MKKFIAYIILGSMYSNTLNASSLVEMIIPPYPRDMGSNHGACIAQIMGYKNTCDYSVSDLHNKDQKPHAILAKKKLSMNEKNPIWKVTDQIPYPDIGKGELLSISTCRYNGIRDHTILAVVIDTDTDKEWLKATAWVRKVNLDSGIFSIISPDNIECENEGWGI